MQNKLLKTFGVYSIALLAACSTNHSETASPKEDCIYGKEEFDALNEILNLENKVSIIRMGSIEMIPNYSVITFDPAYLDSSDIKVKYSWVFDIHGINQPPNNGPVVITPTTTTTYFWLKSKPIGHRKLDSSLKLYDHCSYAKYVEKYVERYNKEGFGEGYGGNKYIVYFGKNKKFGVVDKYSSTQIKDYITHLFRQVSINEYVQTYSLEKDWKIYKDSVAYMFNHFDSVSQERDFVIKDNWFK